MKQSVVSVKCIQKFVENIVLWLKTLQYFWMFFAWESGFDICNVYSSILKRIKLVEYTNSNLLALVAHLSHNCLQELIVIYISIRFKIFDDLVALIKILCDAIVYQSLIKVIFTQ